MGRQLFSFFFRAYGGVGEKGFLLLSLGFFSPRSTQHPLLFFSSKGSLDPGGGVYGYFLALELSARLASLHVGHCMGDMLSQLDLRYSERLFRAV